MTTSISHAMVLGAVHGISEFLPISSSAHLILVPWFLHWERPGLALSIFLHLGELVALSLYFLPELLGALRGGFSSVLERRIGFDRDRLLFWWIVIGTLPAALVAALLYHRSEDLFQSPLLVAISLSAVGFLIYWVDDHFPLLRNLQEMHFSDVWWVGLAQAFSIIPGVSRTGASFGMARRLGFNREDSARYAFLLCFPIALGAGLFELWHLLEQSGQLTNWAVLWSGFGASLVVGFLAIHFMLQFLRYRTIALFCWYRIGLAAAIILYSLIFKA